MKNAKQKNGFIISLKELNVRIPIKEEIESDIYGIWQVYMPRYL